MNNDEINEIKTIITESGYESDGCGSDDTWTENLNMRFETITKSHSKSFVVYNKTLNKEWLYDITICNQTGEYIDETYLVAESEWDKNEEEIWYDFQKLLLCNSKYKVMIFSKKDAEQQNTMFTDMRKQIESYKTCNGIFILASFVENEGYSFEIVESND